jgi:undecaprenyl-diphosphatase
MILRGMNGTPAALTPAQRRWLGTVALAAALVFLGLGALVHTDFVFSIDRGTQRFVQAERVPAYDGAMQTITRLGSGWVLLPITAVGCLVVGMRHRRLALSFVLTALGAVIIESAMKGLVGRHRPNAYAWGYPSAHVLGVVVFLGMALYLLWALGVSRGPRALMGALAIVVVVGVAVSRLWVNAHWLSDVVGGLAGGTAVVLAVTIVLDRRTRAPAS